MGALEYWSVDPIFRRSNTPPPRASNLIAGIRSGSGMNLGPGRNETHVCFDGHELACDEPAPLGEVIARVADDSGLLTKSFAAVAKGKFD